MPETETLNEARCKQCGGTRLPHAASGAERGSCHCMRGPGRVRAKLHYATETQPAMRTYSVEWMGEEVHVDPPTLPNAVLELERRRRDWRRAHVAQRFAAVPLYVVEVLFRTSVHYHNETLATMWVVRAKSEEDAARRVTTAAARHEEVRELLWRRGGDPKHPSQVTTTLFDNVYGTRRALFENTYGVPLDEVADMPVCAAMGD